LLPQLMRLSDESTLPLPVCMPSDSTRGHDFLNR
jgi:hypothetical protein